MSKKVSDLKKYKGHSNQEVLISKWLESKQGEAFTANEIYNSLRKKLDFTPDANGNYWTWGNAGILVLSVLDSVAFHDVLRKMTSSGKIKMIERDLEEYYYYE